MNKNKGLNIPVLATNLTQSGVLGKIDNNFDNFIKMLRVQPYKAATLHKPSKASATWFVIWYNYNPETERVERIRKTFDLNRIADIKERERMGNTYCCLINEALRNGWNFFGAVPSPTATPDQEPATKHIREALRKHCRSLKKRSVQSYTSTVNLLTGWMSENGCRDLPIKDFTPAVIYDYIDYRKSQGISNKTVNTHTEYMHKLFSLIVKAKIIGTNPYGEIDKLPETESMYYEVITPEELKRISEYLTTQHPDYLLYLKGIYWQAIRPYHLSMYQNKLIDYRQDIVTTTGDITKNRKNHRQQLQQAFKDGLIQSGRHTLPGHWYLFGTGFKPSPNYCETLSTRAGELWQQYVVGDLGINKKMYALKHSFGTHYIDNSEHTDALWLQSQMKHSSIAQTEAYIKKQKVKRIDQDSLNVPMF